MKTIAVLTFKGKAYKNHSKFTSYHMQVAGHCFTIAETTKTLLVNANIRPKNNVYKPKVSILV